MKFCEKCYNIIYYIYKYCKNGPKMRQRAKYNVRGIY